MQVGRVLTSSWRGLSPAGLTLRRPSHLPDHAHVVQPHIYSVKLSHFFCYSSKLLSLKNASGSGPGNVQEFVDVVHKLSTSLPRRRILDCLRQCYKNVANSRHNLGHPLFHRQMSCPPIPDLYRFKLLSVGEMTNRELRHSYRRGQGCLRKYLWAHLWKYGYWFCSMTLTVAYLAEREACFPRGPLARSLSRLCSVVHRL